jgi:tubulin gamma
VIFVNTGQCGNQVGFDVIDGMFEHLCDASVESATSRHRLRRGISGDCDSSTHPMDGLDAFFRPSSSDPSGYTARAVCVDTEPKVVLNCMSQCRRRGWRLDPARAVFSHGGAGNNWAMGYQMGSGKLLDTALDSIRYAA